MFDPGFLNLVYNSDRDMVTMFEEAYKQQPSNEELGAQTFFANVRAAQWKSAQQVSSFTHSNFRKHASKLVNIFSCLRR